ncbi:MAG: hypothetical protein Q8Q30_02965 [Candidatus Woesebacteria bacterium]|nr:hypothetical protein [Candidatus Woesebacteria bacterium]
METLIIPDRSIWSNELFFNSFNFNRVNDGFSKEVNGQKYFFNEVNTADELKQVVNIQKKAWRWEDRELAPVHILALMKDTGGGVYAAYNDTSRMIGFAAGFGGGKDVLTGKPILISSMLAIANSELRNKGVGKELKIIQALHAFQNGYDMMKWLYDPERGGNASLNLTKLGAMAEEFCIDKYGEMRSALYGKVPTDRFRAVWRYTEPRVINRILQKDNPKSFDSLLDIPVAKPNYMPIAEKVLVQISPNIDDEEEQKKLKDDSI